MSIIRNLVESAAREYREFSLAKWESWLDSLGGGPTATGIDVTVDKALTCSVVWACLRCKYEDMTKIPLSLYERMGANGDDGRQTAYRHPLYRTLRVQANPWMTAVVFRRAMQMDLDIHGAAYAAIGVNNGRIELWPRPASQITPEVVNGELKFKWVPGTGEATYYSPSQLFRLIGATRDGITPISPIQTFRETIGLDLAYRDHAAYLFKNRATPSIVLETALSLTPQKAAELLESFTKGWAGLGHSGKTALAHSGLSVKPMGFSNQDAQYIDSQHLSVEQLCRVWRIPPHKVMDYLRATFSNVTQIDLSYLNDALKPDQTVWEEAINAQLLSESDQGRYYAEFDNFDLLKGTPSERADVETKYVNAGISTRNEVRRSHNWNPIDGGDDATVQVQNVPLDMLQTIAAKEVQDAGKTGNPGTAN